MIGHRLFKGVVTGVVSFIVVGRATVLAVPMLRHYLVAVVNDPTGLPALETDPRVH